jgi:hypothetical protein
MILKKAGVSELENSTTQGRMKPPVGATLKTAHPLANGLVGAWLFNEGSGSVITDYSPSAKNGTLYGASWGADGNPRIQCSNMGHYVDTASYTVGSAAGISVFGLVYINSNYVLLSPVFQIGTQTGTAYWHWLYFAKLSNRFVWQYSNGATYRECIFSGTLSPSHLWVWHRVGVSHDYVNKTVKLYYNGVLNRTITHTDDVVAPSSKIVRMGSHSGGGVDQLYGNLSTILTWNRPLSDSEHFVIANEPYCMFY